MICFYPRRAELVGDFLLQGELCMKEILKRLLKFYSSKEIDITEEYEKIRKFQGIISMNIEIEERNKDRILPVGEGIRVRLFEPEKMESEEVICYFHGGGWVIGSIDYFAQACMNITKATARRVISVDYRLAPENPFPAGFDDCFNAVEAILGGSMLKTSPEHLILMGDSAGGNIAAAISLKVRNLKKPLPKAQVLFYPVLYWDHSENSPFPSAIENGFDYGLTSKNVDEYYSLYVKKEEDRKNPYAAPLMAEDFSNQPPTLIITSEFDPLRDEGEAYGERLRSAGGLVRVERMKDAVHGFINFPWLFSAVKESLTIVREFLDGLN